jgi:hypothetical protein
MRFSQSECAQVHRAGGSQLRNGNKVIIALDRLFHAGRDSSHRLVAQWLGLLLTFVLPALLHAQTGQEQARLVEVRFVKSPHADYLFYLLFRSAGDFPQLDTVVPLGKIPSLDQTISLPEQAASDQIESYSELYPLLKQYRETTGRIAEILGGSVEHFRILAYGYELPPYRQLDEIVHEANNGCELLVFQGNHGIDAHRAACRDVAGQQCDQDEHDCHAEERQRIGWFHAVEQAR